MYRLCWEFVIKYSSGCEAPKDWWGAQAVFVVYLALTDYFIVFAEFH